MYGVSRWRHPQLSVIHPTATQVSDIQTDTMALLKYLRLVFIMLLQFIILLQPLGVFQNNGDRPCADMGTYLQITYRKGLGPGKQSGGGVLYKGTCVCVHCIMQTFGEACVAKHNKRIRPCPWAIAVGWKVQCIYRR